MISEKDHVWTSFITETKTDGSSLSEEDFKFFDKVTNKDNCRTLKSYIENPNLITLFFDKGFIIYSIDNIINDIYNNERICTIYALFKTKKPGKSIIDIGWSKIAAGFWHYLKKNKCTKVLCYTKLDPSVFEKYGFKLKRYEMERDI